MLLRNNKRENYHQTFSLLSNNYYIKHEIHEIFATDKITEENASFLDISQPHLQVNYP